MARLTKRQRRFAEEYLIDLNATKAAVRAGYSPKTAKQIGAENLTKPDLHAYIERAMAERSRRTGINQDRVVLELAKIALANIEDIVDLSTLEIKPDVAPEDSACILSTKIRTFQSKDGPILEREVRLSPKIKALELLGRHLGMFNDKLDLTGAVPVVIMGDDQLED